MRLAFLHMLAALLAPTALFAFNSAKWLEKRDAMSADAARMREAYSNCMDKITTPSEGLTIPLETNPDGSVCSSIHADKAQFFLNSPLIWAENLVLTKQDPQGRERSRLEAARCVIDRVSRSGWIDGHAKVVQDDLVFEGEGVYFSATNNFVTVYSGSDMQSKKLKFGGVKDSRKPAKGGDKSGRIRADRSDLDRAEGVAMFEGNVRVEYTNDYSLNANRLFALFKGTNELTRIVASGNVTLTNDTRCGSSDLAVFRNSEHRIEMFGKPDCPAQLSETSGHRSTVRGSKITYWVDTEQVEVLSPVITLEEQNVR